MIQTEITMSGSTQHADTTGWFEPAHNISPYHGRPEVATTDITPRPISPPPSYPGHATTILQQNQSVVSNDKWTVYCKRSALLQGVCGFLCVALGFVCVALECEYSDSLFAVWCAVWIIFTASLGVSAVRHPGNNCVMCTYMIFSFFSVACGILVASISCAAAVAEDRQKEAPPYAVRVTVDAITSFVATMEILFAIVGCTAAGKKTCGKDTHDVLIRRNYYVSHLSSNDIIAVNTRDIGPPQYQSDFHPLQVPPHYNTFESPPSYEANEEQSGMDAKKNNENHQRVP